MSQSYLRSIYLRLAGVVMLQNVAQGVYRIQQRQDPFAALALVAGGRSAGRRLHPGQVLLSQQFDALML